MRGESTGGRVSREGEWVSSGEWVSTECPEFPVGGGVLAGGWLPPHPSNKKNPANVKWGISVVIIFGSCFASSVAIDHLNSRLY